MNTSSAAQIDPATVHALRREHAAHEAAVARQLRRALGQPEAAPEPEVKPKLEGTPWRFAEVALLGLAAGATVALLKPPRNRAADPFSPDALALPPVPDFLAMFAFGELDEQAAAQAQEQERLRQMETDDEQDRRRRERERAERDHRREQALLRFLGREREEPEDDGVSDVTFEELDEGEEPDEAPLVLGDDFAASLDHLANKATKKQLKRAVEAFRRALDGRGGGPEHMAKMRDAKQRKQGPKPPRRAPRAGPTTRVGPGRSSQIKGDTTPDQERLDFSGLGLHRRRVPSDQPPDHSPPRRAPLRAVVFEDDDEPEAQVPRVVPAKATSGDSTPWLVALALGLVGLGVAHAALKRRDDRDRFAVPQLPLAAWPLMPQAPQIVIPSKGGDE